MNLEEPNTLSSSQEITNTLIPRNPSIKRKRNDFEGQAGLRFHGDLRISPFKEKGTDEKEPKEQKPKTSINFSGFQADQNTIQQIKMEKQIHLNHFSQASIFIFSKNNLDNLEDSVYHLEDLLQKLEEIEEEIIEPHQNIEEQEQVTIIISITFIYSRYLKRSSLRSI